jgi:transcriptional regulator with XRE-family HTH domain
MMMPMQMQTENTTTSRVYSRQAKLAAVALGQLIRIHRIERKLSVSALAERAGISRDLMQRIEHGDPRCGIGAAFEAAVIVGVTLFEQEHRDLADQVHSNSQQLMLLPKSIRTKTVAVKDAF